MARAPHREDFVIDVEGVGQFKFGRRTKKDQYKIRGLYSKLTGDNWKEDEEGNQVVGDLEAWIHANLEVLTVEYPDSFSLEKLDPLKDPENDDRLSRIYMALRQKEASFRTQPATGGAKESVGSGS